MRAAEGNGFTLRLDVRLSRAVAGAVRHLQRRYSPHTTGLTVGPMVTNPGTRDWSVTASQFATLNDMFGNRTVCGIGRGDSARRVDRAATRRPWPSCAPRRHVIRELAEGREVVHNGVPVRLPWVRDGRLPVWMAAYGPKALRLAGEVADGFILQTADPTIARWTIGAVRKAAVDAGRDPGADHDVRRRARVRRDRPRPPAGPAAAGSAAWSATTSPTWSHEYGERRRDPGRADHYIKAGEGYDYGRHGRAGNPTTEFVPDEVIDRFCVLGPEAAHVERLEELAELGVHQFALYLMHDRPEETLRAYGHHVVDKLR